MKTPDTILWYDYETWGATPSRDTIAQFAGVRTDMDLNPIGEPVNLLCQPNKDTCVSPEAVLVTNLSPLTLAKEGIPEWQFAREVQQIMSVPNTCTAGYNSIRFDDECTRYLLYRNLIDPYAREWQNGNSRWDLLDVMRMAHALRPEGITWPKHDDGSPSFKLEHLTKANGIIHESAHDAVSDVLATIALAKRLKDQQPKLFDYAFSLRSKHQARKQLDLAGHQPHLHFSGKIPASELCLGVEIPVAVHPQRGNEIIVLDIREDPSWILDSPTEQLSKWLYARTEDLPAGAKRPPVKTIHINRSPMLASIKLLHESLQDRLKLSDQKLATHRNWFMNNAVEVKEKLANLFTNQSTISDLGSIPAEQQLYSGFINNQDRKQLNQLVSQAPNATWLEAANFFDDERLPELIVASLARHAPSELDGIHMEEWQLQRKGYFEETNTLRNAATRTLALIKQHPENLALKDTLKWLKQVSESFNITIDFSEPAIEKTPRENDAGEPDQLQLF